MMWIILYLVIGCAGALLYSQDEMLPLAGWLLWLALGPLMVAAGILCLGIAGVIDAARKAYRWSHR